MPSEEMSAEGNDVQAPQSHKRALVADENSKWRDDQSSACSVFAEAEPEKRIKTSESPTPPIVPDETSLKSNGQRDEGDGSDALSAASKERDFFKAKAEAFETQHKSITDQLAQTKKELENAVSQIVRVTGKSSKAKEVMTKLLIEASKIERKTALEAMKENRRRLGQEEMSGFKDLDVEEEVKEGYAFRHLAALKERIQAEREKMDAATKDFRKNRPPPNKPAAADDDGGCLDAPTDLEIHDFHEQNEIYRLRTHQLKKEDAECVVERGRLDQERLVHLQEMKRIFDENASKDKIHIVIRGRFLLLSLLGKGGFGEVWKCYDLDENRYAAFKIHEVDKNWNEQRRSEFMNDAVREKDIQKSLIHRRIVSVYDGFKLDSVSFCTVLEYCDGNDLDVHLKQNKVLTEKEARSIIMQVVSALKYLSAQDPPVIHYDLKPANILLSSGLASGEIKITDFGLSKLAAGEESNGEMDLTTPLGGTYQYLPPECVYIGSRSSPPKISSKVDVWSVGVIFFQCLFGKLPFGNMGSTDTLMGDHKTHLYNGLQFPNKTGVTAEAKDFIRRCLEHEKEDRASVEELYMSEYLRSRVQRTQA